MAHIFTKGAGDKLDYTFDWTDWLTGGEQIASVIFTVSTGLTKSDESHTGTTATVFLSGGTVGAEYTVSCQITTNNVVPRIKTRHLVMRLTASEVED